MAKQIAREDAREAVLPSFLPLPTPSPLLPSSQSPFPSSTKKAPHRFTCRRGEGGTTNNLIFTVYRLWQRRRPRRLLHWRCVSVSVSCVSVSLVCVLRVCVFVTVSVTMSVTSLCFLPLTLCHYACPSLCFLPLTRLLHAFYTPVSLSFSLSPSLSPSSLAASIHINVSLHHLSTLVSLPPTPLSLFVALSLSRSLSHSLALSLPSPPPFPTSPFPSPSLFSVCRFVCECYKIMTTMLLLCTCVWARHQCVRACSIDVQYLMPLQFADLNFVRMRF
jgi:hypothetical protein